jgi:hypothetical protein
MARRSRPAVQLPKAMSHVNKARVPAVWVQTVTAALFTLIAFVIVPSVVGGKSAVDSRTKIYDVIQAAVTVSWCISIVVLFVDILIILRRYRAQSRRAGSPTSGVLSVLHHRRARLAGGDHRHAAGLVDSADQQQSRVGQHPRGSDLLRHLVLVGGRHHVGLLASRCCCTAEAYIDHRRELGVAEQAIVAGDGSAAGESLELAPFGKVLFSSDAWARRGSTTWARCCGAGPPFEYWVTGWPAATRRIPLGQWLASSFVK